MRCSVAVLVAVGVWWGLLGAGLPAWAEEPDYGNNYGAATPIPTNGSEVEGTLLPEGGDEDWFSFAAQADRLYEVRLYTQAWYKQLELYRLSGVGELVSVSALGTFGDWVEQEVLLFPGGTYYLRAYDPYYGGSGLYRLSVLEAGNYATDQYPDTCLAPAPLTVNGPAATDAITFFGWDEDWLTFDTDPLYMYSIAFTQSVGADVVYELRRHGCGETLYTASEGQITFVSWDGAGYDLRVHSSSFTRDGYYEIQVDDLGGYADDYGNTYGAATVIPTNGTPQTGAIQYEATVGSDEDWFQFTGSAGELYEITLESQAGYRSVQLYRYTGTGEPSLLMNWGTWGGSAAQKVFFSHAGQYYLQVAGQTGVYHLTVSLMGTYGSDSYPDSCASPAPLATNGTPVEDGITNHGWDEDWFIFSTDALYSYQITLTPAYGCDVIAELRRSACGEALYSWAGPLTFVSWDGADYLLRVRSSSFNREGYYTLAVQDLGAGADDHGNTYQTATVISPNGQDVTGAIQYQATVGGDEDWFRFNVTVLEPYHFEITQMEGALCLMVYEWNGQTGQLDPLLGLGWCGGGPSDLAFPRLGTAYLQASGGLGAYAFRVSSPAPECGDLDHPYPTADLNHDCEVNLKDLALLAGHWLESTKP